MQLAATCEVSDLLALAFFIRRSLVGPASFSIEEDGSRITVKGRLNLSHEEITTRSTALCTFIIPAAWQQRQPGMWCHETWRKLPLPGGGCNAEWHVLDGGSLCYELPHRWINEISAAEQIGDSAALELGSVHN